MFAVGIQIDILCECLLVDSSFKCDLLCLTFSILGVYAFAPN
jgi:hypothetical protein